MSVSRLEAVCREQDAKWLHRLSLGIDDEEVCSNFLPAAVSLTQLIGAVNVISSPAGPRVQNRMWTQSCQTCKPSIFWTPVAKPCWLVTQSQAV